MQSRKSALRRLASNAKYRWNSARIGYLRREQALLNKQRYFKDYQHNIYLLNRAALKIQHWFINQLQRIADKQQPRPIFSELKKGYFIKAPIQLPWKMSIKSCSTTPKNCKQFVQSHALTPPRAFTTYDSWNYEESPEGKEISELNLSFSDKVKMSSNCINSQVLESLKLGEEINRSPSKVKLKTAEAESKKKSTPPLFQDYKNYKQNKAYALKKFLKCAYKKLEISSFRSPQQPRQTHTPKAAEATRRGSLYQEVIGRKSSKSRSKSKEKKDTKLAKYFSITSQGEQRKYSSKKGGLNLKGYSSVRGAMLSGQSKTPKNLKTNKPLFSMKRNDTNQKSVKDLKACLWAQDLEIETKLNTDDASQEYLQELRAKAIDTPSFKDQIVGDFVQRNNDGKFNRRTLIKIANSCVPKKKENIVPRQPRERLSSTEDSVMTNYSSHTEGSYEVNQYDSVQTMGSREEQSSFPVKGPKIAEYFSEREALPRQLSAFKDYESVPCGGKKIKKQLNPTEKQSAWSLVQEFYQIQEFAASEIQKAWRQRKQRNV